MLKKMSKKQGIVLLSAMFLLNFALTDLFAVVATRYSPAAPSKAPASTAKTTTTSSAQLSGTKAPAAAPASAPSQADTQARAGTAAIDAVTKIVNLTKRIGAAKGVLANDAQAGLSTAKTDAEKATARTAFLSEVQSLFGLKGVAVGDTGYQLARFKLKLFLKVIAGQATQQDLAQVRTVILNNASAPEFADTLVASYTANDFLDAAGKSTVAAWILNGWNNDGTYFSAQNCSGPAQTTTTTAATTPTPTTATTPAKAPATTTKTTTKTTTTTTKTTAKPTASGR